MEEHDDHGLNLSLTLKPPSKYLPSKLLQMLPSPHNLPPHDKPTAYSPTMEAEKEWERMNKEIVASIEEKRRLEAEMEEEREWELRQERKQQQRREVAEEVAVVVSPPNSTVSVSSSGKKRGEREESYEAETDLSEKYIIIGEDENGGDAVAMAARKKLMMSKNQAAVLEETFKENNSPSTKEKIELAKQLDLWPRQVEVWFQNRRARTKLKQTELNYDNLKTYCEVMNIENIRLKKEITDLKAFKHFHQSYMNKFPSTNFVMCPQCTQVTKFSSSIQSSSAAAGAANTNNQNLVGSNSIKSTPGIPFAKLISSEALNFPLRLP